MDIADYFISDYNSIFIGTMYHMRNKVTTKESFVLINREEELSPEPAAPISFMELR